MIDFDNAVLLRRWPDAVANEIASRGGRDCLFRFDGQQWRRIPATAANVREWQAQRTIVRAMTPLSPTARARIARRHAWLFGRERSGKRGCRACNREYQARRKQRLRGLR